MMGQLFMLLRLGAMLGLLVLAADDYRHGDRMAAVLALGLALLATR
jgi:hypothetical protein